MSVEQQEIARQVQVSADCDEQNIKLICSLATLIALLLSYEVLTFIAHWVHSKLLGPESLNASWFFDTDPVQAILILVVLVLRPGIFGLSRMQPKWEDLGWLIFGFAINSVPYASVEAAPLGRRYLWASIFALIFSGPLLEELFVRGIFLRSLVERFPKLIVILGLSLLWAADHVSFWAALPLQLTLGFVYVYRRNSIAASFACHVGGNLAALVFYSKVV